MASTRAPAALPAVEHDALARLVNRFGLGDVLLDLAATTEGIAFESDDLRAVERRGELAQRLLAAAIAAERLRL